MTMRKIDDKDVAYMRTDGEKMRTEASNITTFGVRFLNIMILGVGSWYADE